MTMFCMQCSSSLFLAHPETVEGLVRCTRCQAMYVVDEDAEGAWFLIPAVGEQPADIPC